MMNIIGWVALIYIFIGCGLVIALYAGLSYSDNFEDFMHEIIDDQFRRFSDFNALRDETAASVITLTFIANWLLILIIVIYLIVQDVKKKDEA